MKSVHLCPQYVWSLFYVTTVVTSCRLAYLITAVESADPPPYAQQSSEAKKLTIVVR